MSIDSSIYNRVQAPNVNLLAHGLNKMAEQRQQKPFNELALAQERETLAGKVAANGSLQLQGLLDVGDADGAAAVINSTRSQLGEMGINPPESPVLRALTAGDLETAKKLNGANISRLTKLGFIDPGMGNTAEIANRNNLLSMLDGAFTPDGQLKPEDQLTPEQRLGATEAGWLARKVGNAETTAATNKGLGDSVINFSANKAGAVADAKNKADAAGATDKKFQEQLGAEGAKIYGKLQTAAQEASAFIPRLQSLKELASQVDTGTGAEIKLAAKKALGVDSADMEELNAKLGELAQDILNQQTGTKTDFDFQNAVRQSAALGKTKEANIRLINALIERQIQAVNFGDQAREAYDQFGPKGVLDMRFKSPTSQKQGGKVMIDANGNKAMVYSDGSFEEIE